MGATMTPSKQPKSLRSFSRSNTATKSGAPIVHKVASAVLALAAGVSTEAGAQSPATAPASPPPSAQQVQPPAKAGENLPPLTVEAPKAAPRARTRQAGPSAATAAAPQPAQAPSDAQSANADAASGDVAPGANPYADKAAPFKIDRSANSKFTEPLLDTPKTITVIPKEVIQEKGATTMRDLARTTPGVTLGTGEGGNPFGDRLYIRGFDARNDAYINGIRDPGVPIRETFNTEQIEILKGPSATISGRGTAGGAVNVITKQAQDKNFTQGTTTLGTDNTVRGTLDHNMALGDTFAIRGNLMWQQADVAGRDEVFDDRMGAAIALKWLPTRDVKITTDYYHLKLNQLPDWGVPWDGVGRRPFTESGVNRSNYYGYPARDFQKGQQDILTTGLEYKVNEALTLSSRFRYGVSLIDYIASAPEAVTRTSSDPFNWTAQLRPKSRWQENEVYANQTDATYKFEMFGVKHTLISGAEVSRELVSRDAYTGLASEAFNPGPGVPAGTLIVPLFNPNTGAIGFSGAPTLSGNLTRVLVETSAFYLLDTIKLNEQWILNGGLRFDNYGLHYDALAAATGAHSRLSRNDHLVNYNLGITYKPLPNASVYAAYATSSSPVGQELDGNGDSYGGISSGNALLDPEKNTSVEFGTKWELFNRHLLATAAVFQTTKESAREAAGQLVFSTGKYQIRGYELGIGGNITPALSVYGGYVGMESEVLESRTQADVGKKLANIAHDSFNLLAKYKITDWLSVGGQATYRGQIFGGTLARNDNAVTEFWRFDAMADFRINDKFTLSVQGLNLTDQVYYDALYRSGTPFVYIAPGRVGYLTLKAKY